MYIYIYDQRRSLKCSQGAFANEPLITGLICGEWPANQGCFFWTFTIQYTLSVENEDRPSKQIRNTTYPAYIYMYVYVYIYIHIYVCMYVCMCVCVCVYIYIYIYICIYIRIHMCVNIFTVNVYINIYIYGYILI